MDYKSIEVTAPASWASYLINDDNSGLELGDIKQADAMIQSICESYGKAYVVDCSDSFFKWHPDYGMAGDCCIYTVHV